MSEELEFDPTTGELKRKPLDSSLDVNAFGQNENSTEIASVAVEGRSPDYIERTPNYIERVLSNTLRISIHRITNSGLYEFAQQSFSFSKKFTITKTVATSLMAQAAFGIVLMILLLPLALLFDITILIGGICLGSILFLLIFIVFVFVFLFLIVKSLFNL